MTVHAFHSLHRAKGCSLYTTHCGLPMITPTLKQPDIVSRGVGGGGGGGGGGWAEGHYPL